MNKEKLPYVRIGTKYYRIVVQPTFSGDSIEKLITWNKETLLEDYKKYDLVDIPKYISKICIPSHVNYQRVINNHLNIYEKLPYSPLENVSEEDIMKNIKYTLMFLNHIFGEQLQFGLDYIQLLYLYPTQVLPILCLVSKERATGKTTFIKWQKSIFGGNMTYIKGDSFSSQFNADWASKLLIAIDEVFFDKKEITERLKYLSTTDKDKLEAKGKDREEIEFFGKFVLCSNNEDSFIIIDPEEIRFWVRKIKPFEKEDTEFLNKLNLEIPYFLTYLTHRKLSTEKKSRMWFTQNQIKTKALQKLMRTNTGKVEKEIVSVFYELIESENIQEIKTTPLEILELIKKMKGYRIESNEIRKVLKNTWKLEPKSNSLAYQTYEYSYGDFMLIGKTGRYFTIPNHLIFKKFDELMS